MKALKGNNIFLIVGFLFLTISSLHPIDHIGLDDQSEQIECQLCYNDTSQPHKNKSLESNYNLSSILKEKQKKMIGNINKIRFSSTRLWMNMQTQHQGQIIS